MPNRHLLLAAWVTAALLALAASAAASAGPSEDRLIRAVPARGSAGAAAMAPGQYRAAATLDTVWYGFVPGGTAATNGPGGSWDFDRKPGGGRAPAGDPDALQGWTPCVTPFLSGGTRPAACRPDWFLNYGNHGTYWHQQDMTLVANRAGAPNSNISGTGVAWCGLLRGPGGAYSAADLLHDYRTTPPCAVNFPGYGDLWDQYLVKDVVCAGAGTLSFDYRVDTDARAEEAGASLQHGSAYDMLTVYAGVPAAAVPFGGIIPAESDLADLLATQVVLLDNQKGLVGTTRFTSAGFGDGAAGIGAQARVVFRFRSNRQNSDQSGTVSYDGTTKLAGSDYGACEIDNVAFSNATGAGDGLSSYDFDASLQGWTPTAKSLPAWGHIVNVGSNDPAAGELGYDVLEPDVHWADPCGLPGSGSSQCGMQGNVLGLFDDSRAGLDPVGHPFDHYSRSRWPVALGENYQAAYSPNIHIAGTPGAGRTGLVIRTDIYSYTPAAEGVFYWTWLRYRPATSSAGACPNYSSWLRDGVIWETETPTCFAQTFEEQQLVPNPAGVTDYQIMLGAPAMCYAFGDAGASGTCAANFSPLFDNVRLGTWNSPNAPGAVVDDAQLWQDAFPVDNGILSYLPMQKRVVGGVRSNVTPYAKTLAADDPAIDAQTAVLTTNATLNPAPHTAAGAGLYQGDSASIQCGLSPNGTRVDCVFRVLPGPLTDTADTWFQAWMTNTGIFGSGSNGNPSAPVYGMHGGPWKWWLWNSARMDTAASDGLDTNIYVYPDLTNGLASRFQAAYDENDPHYAQLGINHCLPMIDGIPGNGRRWLDDCNVFGITSRENTPIFPSYLFTPGTVIEYFFRTCYTGTPATALFYPDTSVVQAWGSRYYLWRCLPDAWKDYARYGAPPWDGAAWLGDPAHTRVSRTRACGLFVDRSYPAGRAYFPYHDAFDSTGAVVDDYTSRGAGSPESGIGNAVAQLANPTFTFYGSSGPSLKQLSGYREIFYNCSDLANRALADGQSDGDASADVQLFDAWLNLADGHPRFLWLNGASIAKCLDLLRPDGGPSAAFAAELGILPNSVDEGYTGLNYHFLSGDASDCPTVVAGSAPWSVLQRTAVAGNACLEPYDVIPSNPAVGATPSQLFWVGSLGAGVARTLPNGSKTLVDALDFPEVRNVSCHDSYGRLYQMRTVIARYAASGGVPFCPCGPVAITLPGDPGFRNGLFANRPNPFRGSTGTRLHYSVAAESRVRLVVVDVAGRVVRVVKEWNAPPGDYSEGFDGLDARGARLPAGVYFLRLQAGTFTATRKALLLN